MIWHQHQHQEEQRRNEKEKAKSALKLTSHSACQEDEPITSLFAMLPLSLATPLLPSCLSCLCLSCLCCCCLCNIYVNSPRPLIKIERRNGLLRLPTLHMTLPLFLSPSLCFVCVHLEIVHYVHTVYSLLCPCPSFSLLPLSFCVCSYCIQMTSGILGAIIEWKRIILCELIALVTFNLTPGPGDRTRSRNSAAKRQLSHKEQKQRQRNREK